MSNIIKELQLKECEECGYLCIGDCNFCADPVWRVLAMCDCKICGRTFRISRNGYACNECLDNLPF